MNMLSGRYRTNRKKLFLVPFPLNREESCCVQLVICSSIRIKGLTPGKLSSVKLKMLATTERNKIQKSPRKLLVIIEV